MEAVIFQHGDDQAGTPPVYAMAWNGRYNTERAFCKGDDISPEQSASTAFTEGGH